MNKYTLGTKQWRKAIDDAVRRTATEISAAVDHMTYQLPKDVPMHIAIGLVVQELASMQPAFMQLVMEDREVKESYWVATAERRHT